MYKTFTDATVIGEVIKHWTTPFFQFLSTTKGTKGFILEIYTKRTTKHVFRIYIEIFEIPNLIQENLVNKMILGRSMPDARKCFSYLISIKRQASRRMLYVI